jgi:Zn-dependent protease with chaperone function
MDFFSAQDRARRQTTWLAVLFTLSVITICIANCLVAVGLFGLEPAVIAAAVLATLAVVGLGSLWRYVQLANGGGAAVAEMLGGRRLDPNATRLEDRVLLNIVEEMALASGIPVPPVYVLENEHSINAFAAGHSVGEAVIGVNRGTLEQLNRDELQGVIAHEFSHILSGDMRINLKLIAILNGILVLSMIGYFLMRIGGGTGSSSNSDRKGVPHLLVLGLAMWLIGTIGLFFSKLIKSAISRQREYLADASAVQFTRNPDGIAGALKMIAGRGSRLETPEAEAASHMFFGSSTSNWLSTHPPLIDRITRLDPSFQGDFKGYLGSRGRLSATGRLITPETMGRTAPAVRPGSPPPGSRSEDSQDDNTSGAPQPGARRFPGGFPIPFPGAAAGDTAAGMNLPGRLPFPLNPALLLAAIGNPTTSDVQHAQRDRKSVV